MMFIVDSSQLPSTKLQHPVCTRPSAACDLAPFPARPLTRLWEGWSLGGGCRREVRFGLKNAARGRFCPRVDYDCHDP